MRRHPRVETPVPVNAVAEANRVREWPNWWRAKPSLLVLLCLVAGIAFAKAGQRQFWGGQVVRMPDPRAWEKYYEHPLTAVADGDDAAVYVSTEKSIEAFNPRNYMWHRYDGRHAPGFPFGANDLAYGDDKTLYMLTGRQTIWSCPVDGSTLDAGGLAKRFSIGPPWEGFRMGADTRITRAVFDEGKVYAAVSGNGLGVYDPETHGWAVFPLPGEHRDIRDMEFRGARVWLCTAAGVHVMDRTTRRSLDGNYQLDAENLARIHVEGDNSAFALRNDQAFYAFDGAWHGPFLGGPAFDGASDENVTAALPLGGTVLAAATGHGLGSYDTTSRRWTQVIPSGQIPLSPEADVRELRKERSVVLARTSEGLLLLRRPENGSWEARKVGTDPVGDAVLGVDELHGFYSKDSGGLFGFSPTEGGEPRPLIVDTPLDALAARDAEPPQVGDVFGEDSHAWIGLREGGILRYNYLDHSLSAAPLQEEGMGPVERFMANENRRFVLAGGAVYELHAGQGRWDRRTPADKEVRTATARGSHLYALDADGVLQVLTLDGTKVRELFSGSFSTPGRNEYVGDLKSFNGEMGLLALLGDGNQAATYDSRARSWQASLQLPPARTITELSVVWKEEAPPEPATAGDEAPSWAPEPNAGPLHAYYRDDIGGVGYDSSRHLGGDAMEGAVEDILAVMQARQGEVTILARAGLYHYVHASAGFTALPHPEGSGGNIRSITPWGERMLLSTQSGDLWLGTPGKSEWAAVASDTERLSIGREAALWTGTEDKVFLLQQGAATPVPLGMFDGVGTHAAGARWVARGRGARQVCFVGEAGVSLYDFDTHSWQNQSLDAGAINQVRTVGDALLVAGRRGVRSVDTAGALAVTTLLPEGNAYWIGGGGRPRILVRLGSETGVYSFQGPGRAVQERVFETPLDFSGNLRNACLGRVRQDNIVLLDPDGRGGSYNASAGHWTACDLDRAGSGKVLGVVRGTEGVVAFGQPESPRSLYLPSSTGPGWARVSPDLPSSPKRLLVSRDTVWASGGDDTILEYRLAPGSPNAINWPSVISATPRSAASLAVRITQLQQREEEARKRATSAGSEAAAAESRAKDMQSQLSPDTATAISGQEDVVRAATMKQGALAGPLDRLSAEIARNQERAERLAGEKKAADLEAAKLKADELDKTGESGRLETEAGALERSLGLLQTAGASNTGTPDVEGLLSTMPQEVTTDPSVKKALDALSRAKKAREAPTAPASTRPAPLIEEMDQTFEQLERRREIQRKERLRKKEELDRQEKDAAGRLRQAMADRLGTLVSDRKAARDLAKREADALRASRETAQARVESLADQAKELAGEQERKSAERKALERDIALLGTVARETESAILKRGEESEAVRAADQLLDLRGKFEWQKEWRSASLVDFAVQASGGGSTLAVLSDKHCFVFDLSAPSAAAPEALCAARIPLPAAPVTEVGWADNAVLLGNDGRAQYKAVPDRTAKDAPSADLWKAAQGALLPARENRLPVAFDTSPVESSAVRFVPSGNGPAFSMKIGGAWKPLGVSEKGFLVDRVQGIILGPGSELLVFTEDGIGVRSADSAASPDRYEALLPKSAWPGDYGRIGELKERLGCIVAPDGRCYRYGAGAFSTVSPVAETVLEDPLSSLKITQDIDGVSLGSDDALALSENGEFAFDAISDIAVLGKNAAFMTPAGVWAVNLSGKTLLSFERPSGGSFHQADGDDGCWERDGKFHTLADSGKGAWRVFDRQERDFQEVARTGPWIWEGRRPLNGVRIAMDPSVADAVSRTMTAGRFDDDRCLSVESLGGDALLGTANGLWKWTSAGVREYVAHAGKPVQNVRREGDRVLAEIAGTSLSAPLGKIGVPSEWVPLESPSSAPRMTLAGVTFSSERGRVAISTENATLPVWDGGKLYFDKIVDVEDFGGALWTATAHGGVVRHRVRGHLTEAAALAGNAGLASNETAGFACHDETLYLRCAGDRFHKWQNDRWADAAAEVRNVTRASGIGLAWERPNLFEANTLAKVGSSTLRRWCRAGRLAFDTVRGLSSSASASDRVLWATGSGIAEGRITACDWAPENRPLVEMVSYEELPEDAPVDVLDTPTARYLRSDGGATLSKHDGNWTPHPQSMFTKQVPRLGQGEGGDWGWSAAFVDQDEAQRIALDEPLEAPPLFKDGRFSFDCVVAGLAKDRIPATVAGVALDAGVLLQTPAQVIMNRHRESASGMETLHIVRPFPPAPDPGRDVRISPDGRLLNLCSSAPETWTVHAFSGDAWVAGGDPPGPFGRDVAALTALPYGWSSDRILDPGKTRQEPILSDIPDYPWLAMVPGGGCFGFDALNRMAARGGELYLATQGGVAKYALGEGQAGRMISLLLPSSLPAECAVSHIVWKEGAIFARMAGHACTVEESALRPLQAGDDPFSRVARTEYGVREDGVLTMNGRPAQASGVWLLSGRSVVRGVLDFEPARERDAAWVVSENGLFLVDGR